MSTSDCASPKARRQSITVNMGGEEILLSTVDMSRKSSIQMVKAETCLHKFTGRFLPLGSTPKVELAALYIQDAMDCVRIKAYRDKPSALRANRIRQMLYYPRWGVVLGLVILSFIEEPRWCRGSSSDLCNETWKYPTWQMAWLDWRESQIYEGVSLAVLVLDLWLWSRVLGIRQFVRWKTRMLHFIILLTSVMDLLTAVLSTDPGRFRLSPYFRIMFLIFYSPSTRREVMFMLRAMPELAKVLLLLSIHCSLYAWFGVVMFPNEGDEGKQYFHEFFSALWHLQILLTTNNYPDVMMPAYEESRIYFLYFFLYILTGLFFFINLFTGVVYSGYIDAKSRDETELIRNRFEAIDAAFNCLAIACEESTGERCIPPDVLQKLNHELNTNLHVRYIAAPEAEILFGLLDKNGSRNITRTEFRALPGLLNCEISRVEYGLLDKWFPSHHSYRIVQFLIRFVTTSPSFHSVKIWYPSWTPPEWLSGFMVTVKVCTHAPAIGIVNYTLRFKHQPTCDAVAKSVHDISSRAATQFSFTPPARQLPIQVLDEHRGVWVPLVSNLQLFDECQIFCSSMTNERPSDAQQQQHSPTFSATPGGYLFPPGSPKATPPVRQPPTPRGNAPPEALQIPRPVTVKRLFAKMSRVKVSPMSPYRGGYSSQLLDETSPLMEQDRRYSDTTIGTESSTFVTTSSLASECKEFADDESVAPMKGQKKGSWLGKFKWCTAMLTPPTQPYIDLLIDTALVANWILVVIETWPYLEGANDEQMRRGWQNGLDAAFVTLYCVEAVLKILVIGVKGYFSSLQNRWDFCITLACISAVILVAYPNGYDNPNLLKFVVMARMLRLISVLDVFPWFAVIFQTLMSAAPHAKKVSLLLFVMMYFFTIMGIDIFGGKINRDPDSIHFAQLNSTSWAEGAWYPMNFNDMMSGFVMLFACLVMNNWDSYVDGFTAVTSREARIYFTAFWVLGALGCLNIVVSFVLDTFSTEWKRNKDNEERRLDRRDNTMKTLKEFLAEGYTTGDWLTADRQVIGGGEAWVTEGGLVFDVGDITGTTTGQTGHYILRYAGDVPPGMGGDGTMMRADSFLRDMLTKSQN